MPLGGYRGAEPQLLRRRRDGGRAICPMDVFLQNRSSKMWQLFCDIASKTFDAVTVSLYLLLFFATYLYSGLS